MNGEEHREPASATVAGATEAEAKRKLKARLKEIAADRFISSQEQRVTVNELLDDLLTSQENKGAKSVAKLRSHLKALRAFFISRRAADVTTPRCRAVHTRASRRRPRPRHHQPRGWRG